MITLIRNTVDHVRERRTYKTIAPAAAYVRKWLGRNAEYSATFNYLVSADGVQVIRVQGIAADKLLDAVGGIDE